MSLSTPFSHFLSEQPDFRDPSSSSSPLPALYSDLAAHKSSNRSSYDASVDWWARLLFKACLAGAQHRFNSPSSGKGKHLESVLDSDRFILHLDHGLVEACTIEEVGRPLGLGTVAIELQSSRHLYPLKEFLSSSTSLSGPSKARIGLKSLAYNIASTPLTWAFSQISLSLGFGDGADGEAGERDWKRAHGDWVIWDNLQTITDTILSIHRSTPRLSPLESLFSYQSFQTQLVNPALSQLSDIKGDASKTTSTCSALDLQVLIKFMTRDKGLAISDGKVVKLEHLVGEVPSLITEEERGVVNVKDTYARLELQIEELEKRIQERQSRAEKSLREKKREQALSYLRSKRMLEELLEKRTRSLETLHGVLIKIEQAASDVEIVKAYELSTSSLKALLSDARLQPDRIDQSMEEMQETLANADEVRRAVEIGNEGMRIAAGEEEMDDGEIEAELKRLEEESRKERLETLQIDLDRKHAAKLDELSPKERQGQDAEAVLQRLNREGLNDLKEALPAN